MNLIATRPARTFGRFLANLFTPEQNNLVLRNERHLEVSRRLYTCSELAHKPVWELLATDPHFNAALPVANVPYLMRVVITADEVRANFYRCEMEPVGDYVYDPRWRNNGELGYIVGPNDKVEPLTRDRPGLYVDLYEPEISYRRFLTVEEIAHVATFTQCKLLTFDKA